MANYYAALENDGGSTDIDAPDVDAAWHRAVEWVLDADWPDYRSGHDEYVRMTVTGEDPRDTLSGYVRIHDAEDDEPDCVASDDGCHEWASDHQAVGGLRQNPGVWSGPGMRMICAHSCRRCGMIRVETRDPQMIPPLRRITWDTRKEGGLR